MTTKTLWNTNLQLNIIKYPTGKYGFVGSIPAELCEDGRSKIYDSYIEAEKALKNTLKREEYADLGMKRIAEQMDGVYYE